MSNDAEDQFASMRRFKTQRNGWPDFFVQDRKTKTFLGVEVKRGLDTVTSAQHAMFTALEEFGFKIVIWNPKHPKTFVPWRAYKPSRPERVRRRKRDDRVVVFIRVKPEVRTRVAEIAGKRGYPHTMASVVSEMIVKGFALYEASAKSEVPSR